MPWREVASNRYERISIATVVPVRRATCGRREYPFDLRPLNTAVASVVRQALALTVAREFNLSETFATSSFVARAYASPPPGAWVTRNCSLLSALVRTSSLDQPIPLPS